MNQPFIGNPYKSLLIQPNKKGLKYQSSNYCPPILQDKAILYKDKTYTLKNNLGVLNKPIILLHNSLNDSSSYDNIINAKQYYSKYRFFLLQWKQIHQKDQSNILDYYVEFKTQKICKQPKDIKLNMFVYEYKKEQILKRMNK
ncbi:hypothetical protein pb186bvf_010930 [Paramecium bursaria]